MSERLAESIRDALAPTGKTLAVLESCTGGLLASSLTDVPGAGYFLGGGVAYGAGVKKKFGVPAETIEQFGLVSREVALSLAECAAAWFACDFGVGITGEADTNGDTAESEAGFAAVWHGGSGSVIVLKPRGANREEAKAQMVESVLAHLLEQVEAGLLKATEVPGCHANDSSEQRLDEDLMASFPASDPSSTSPIVRTGAPRSD